MNGAFPNAGLSRYDAYPEPLVRQCDDGSFSNLLPHSSDMVDHTAA
jgi:hypothetical protein